MKVMLSLPDDIMKNRACVLSTTILLVFAAAGASVQEKPEGPPPAPGRGAMGRPIVLGPDSAVAAPLGGNARTPFGKARECHVRARQRALPDRSSEASASAASRAVTLSL